MARCRRSLAAAQNLETDFHNYYYRCPVVSFQNCCCYFDSSSSDYYVSFVHQKIHHHHLFYCRLYSVDYVEVDNHEGEEDKERGIHHHP